MAMLLLGATALTGCIEPHPQITENQAECPWKPDESVTTEAEIGWQPIPNGDLVVKDRGLLEACMPNATITWTTFSSGSDVVNAFASDSIDLGLMGSSPAVTAVSPDANLDLSVVWIQDVIGDSESLIARDQGVTSLKGLAGKSIAVPYGSTSHYSLLQALSLAGMKESDVELINMEPEVMLGPWKRGDIDAAWVWDPTKGQLLANGGHPVMSSADTATEGFPTFDMELGTQSFVQQNKAFMTQWAKVQDYAVSMIRTKPGQAAESMISQLGAGYTVPEMKKIMLGYTYLSAQQQAGPDYLGGKMSTDLETTGRFLLAQASISKVLPKSTYEQHVDPGPAQEAAR